MRDITLSKINEHNGHISTISIDPTTIESVEEVESFLIPQTNQYNQRENDISFENVAFITTKSGREFYVAESAQDVRRKKERATTR